MKKILLIACCLFTSGAVLSATTPDPQAQYKIEMAKKGCQKPIGFFPTPAKLACMLTSLGLPENQIKAKQLAIIFGTCLGHTTQRPSDTKPKTYATLGHCLNDPNAISVINTELGAQGFAPIKVVNPAVFNAGVPR